MERESQLEMGPVVVGYDGSDAARRGLLRAALLAGGRLPLIVVSVSQPAIRSPAGETLVEASLPEETDALLDEAASLLAARGAEFSTRAEEGAPADVLVRIARETDAALVVVGVRGRSFVARALVGSVPADLVERAPCDLLVAR
jgi:nucleotide-binding universal stress UspA family protein